MEKNIDDLALELAEKVLEKSGKNTASEKKKRTKILQFRVTEDELKIIDERFKKSYAETRGEYLRRSALSSLNIVLDVDKFMRQNRQISGIVNNINQIATRVNSTGNLYAEDLQEIREEIQELWRLQISILSELHSINQFSTSLTETKPETASLLLATAAHLMHEQQQNSSPKSKPVEVEEVPFQHSILFKVSLLMKSPPNRLSVSEWNFVRNFLAMIISIFLLLTQTMNTSIITSQ